MSGKNPYSHAKVYKLVHLGEPQYYYWGSTCNSLSHRFSQHKKVAVKEIERKVYKVFNELGWDNIDIILEKEFQLENKEQLHKEEYSYIKASISDPLCLNSRLTGTGLSKQEFDKLYSQEHSEQIKERTKQYYEVNKEHIKENVSKWIQENPDKRKNISNHYYKNHHEEINVKVKCECGVEFIRSHIRRHERSKKHITYIATKTEKQI